MTKRSDVLILPSDTPPNTLGLKKDILFFDSVTLANPKDIALINEMEVVEKMGPYSIGWAKRNDFPRSEGYEDVFNELLKDSGSLLNSGVLRLTPTGRLPNLDAGTNYTIWHSAISHKNLVEAAAPDRFTSQKPIRFPASYMRGGLIEVQGYKSKYEIPETLPAATLEDDIDELWTAFAHLRIGRALKFLRMANAFGLTPLAHDQINRNLLSSTSSLVTRGQNVVDQTLQLDLEIFESEQLFKALDDMSWQDVRHLRKYTLPGMNNLRTYIGRAVQLNASINASDPERYQRELLRLNQEFQNAKEQVAEQWERLRIAAIVRMGGGVGAGTGAGAIADSMGLVGNIIGASWLSVLTSVCAGGLVVTAALTQEIQNLIPARRILKQHPMYFTEQLPR